MPQLTNNSTDSERGSDTDQSDGDSEDPGEELSAEQQVHAGRRKTCTLEEAEALVARTHWETGHMSATAMRTMLTQFCDIRGLKEICRRVTKGCATCATVRGRPRSLRGVKGKIKPNFTQKLQRIACDTLHIAEPDEEFNCSSHVITILDEATDYLVATPLRDMTATESRDKFRDSWVRPFGAPTGPQAQVKTDNGTEFMAEFDTYVQQLNVPHVRTPVGRPKANGKVEKRHDELITQMKLLMEEAGDPDGRWPKYLDVALAMVNRLPRSNGPDHKSPYEHMYQITPMNPALHFFLYGRGIEERERRRDFEKGDAVLYKHPRTVYTKLEPEWRPYVVVEQHSSLTYYIRPLFRTDRENNRALLAHLGSLEAAPDSIADNYREDLEHQGQLEGVQKSEV